MTKIQTLVASLIFTALTTTAQTLVTPTDDQLRWQDMEMYAFIHYSMNTYTDEEWGFGNEPLALFNPSSLDCHQWARVCKQAGMRGIIFTAKHHCGFCMWPSKYTAYSVKNTPWNNGQGDVVHELAEACREEGLKFAVYLSPWDRNHVDYGKPEYITYFRNQLRELLTNYGEMFEVWFDGANGGDGWYGGANETRKIDRTTYYQWPETYRMIRELQPHCLIWNDGGDRGDLRWVGTEAGNVGETNWSLLNKEGDVPYEQLHYGVENGDVWVPGETNTSIRPGWFYHDTENEHVKSLSKLMDTYYKSVGRNSTLLLNFPVAPNGRIHPTDSLRGIAFAKMIQEVFKDDLSKQATVTTTAHGETSVTTLLDFKQPTAFNRFVAEEDIRYGQRVRKFTLEAFVDGQWLPLKDALVEQGDGLTTIGHRRIICFPTVTATRLRFTVTDAKARPLISRVSLYKAPELTPDIADSGEKLSSPLHIFFISPKQMIIDYDSPQTITSFRYLPPQAEKSGTVTHYTLWASSDWQNWQKLATGEFSNIVNNPIWQTIKFAPVQAKILRLDAERLAEGERMGYGDIEVVTDHEPLKPRLVVCTDIAPGDVEPDDMESMVRLLAYADCFEVEALITSVGWNCDPYPTEWKAYLDRVIEAYRKDASKLMIRSGQQSFLPIEQENGMQKMGYWPSADYLASRAVMGSQRGGIKAIGEGNDTPGSDLLIRLADEDDTRPIYVAAWGGANTLAQAIWRVKQTRSAEELKRFVRKFRIYTITDQDMDWGHRMDRARSSHLWLRQEFKDDLQFVWDEGTWQEQCELGKQHWQEHIDYIQGHGALGSEYPNYKWGVEGDTPSFLFVMPNGLSDPEHPEQAGWAGYHQRGVCPDSLTTAWNSWQEPVYTASIGYKRRFYPDELNDFKARMQWAAEGKGNRNPRVVVNGVHGTTPLIINAKAGDTIRLDASASSDPDGNTLGFFFWQQPELGVPVSITANQAVASVAIPATTPKGDIHIICEAHDNGPFHLVGYRRIIIRL